MQSRLSAVHADGKAAPRIQPVLRAPLIDRLLADRDAPVVTINAPGGFGKTSLVSQWLEADDRAFISIAGDDPFFSVGEAFLLAAELIVGSDPVVLVIDGSAVATLTWSKVPWPRRPLLLAQ